MKIDNIDQLRAWQPPFIPRPIIEDGILNPGTVMMLFAAAGSWKTMSATHLACCLATGKPWHGFATNRAIVFTLQVELPKNEAKKRSMKYIDGPGSIRTPDLFFCTPDEDMHLDTTWGIGELEKGLQELYKRRSSKELPIVLIIDPLYLMMKGNISDSYDTKKFIANVNRIRRDYALSIVVIHHSRLMQQDQTGTLQDMGAEELMGSSYWNNWLDTIVRLRVQNPYSGSDTVKVSFGKTRNAHIFLPDFQIRWDRATLIPEVIQRDIVNDEPATIRDLV